MSPLEAARLEILSGYEILDTPPEAAFDALAQLAAQVCDAPVARIGLIDENRQWFKARTGSETAQTPRDEFIYTHILAATTLLYVPDVLLDPRFAAMPAAQGERPIRFYAGAPLIVDGGHVLGSLCVIDYQPRSLSGPQQNALRTIADQVVAQLELRRHGIREKARGNDTVLRSPSEEPSESAMRLEAECARLTEAQAVAKVGSWETDLTTGSVRWSAESHHIFETDPASFQPTHEKFLEIVHPEDRAMVDAAFLKSLECMDPCIIEHRILMADGRIKYVEEHWQAFAGADGKPSRARGTSQDITDRRMAEGHMQLLENSIARINDMIVITSAPFDEPGPEIIFVNDSFERVTGYARSEVLGKSPRFLQGEKTSRAALDRIRAALAAGRPAHEEIINYSKDGREYWADINISPVTDSGGKITHFIATQRDITERKKLEDQFLRAQRMESIGTLAGGIAHDLNNLLSPILMGLDLIRQLEPHDKTQLLLDNMQRSARRGVDLVKQVLSFARGVEGVRIAVHLKQIVHEIEEIIANTFPKNITFDKKLAEDLWLVTGDPTQLNQVLLNLCVNARDAMPRGGQLKISAHNVDIDAQYAVMNRGVMAGRYAVVEVTDTGIGMTKDVIDRIFEPFFTTKAVGSGTGLGLSTVMGIVRSHGGFVNVYSEPGRGSVFKAYLPALEANAATAADNDKPAFMPRGDGELILIVDDESSILSVTKQTLEAFGYRAVTAIDGAEAIGLFALHRAEIAVILTDMMMPVMDGIALITAVQRIDPHLPVIAASGLSSNGSVAKATAAGLKHFLAKPYTTDLLLQMLHRVLTEKSPAGPPKSGPYSDGI